MASSNPNKNSLYPQVLQSNPETNSPFLSNPPPSSSSFYPTIDQSHPYNYGPHPSILTSSSSSFSPPPINMEEEQLLTAEEDSFPDPIKSSEDILITIPGAIAHLIDRQCSIEIGAGDFSVARLHQGDNTVAVLARVGGCDGVQWPLTKDVAAVKLDASHYFFSLRDLYAGDGSASSEADNLLNYGLTIASKGQEGLLRELDGVLDRYAGFSVQRVSEKAAEAFDAPVAPAELESGAKREMMEKRSAAYWTTLAPNVEDYSGSVARVIAAGSGQVIRGILWCGDVTVDRLKWGNEIMKKRMDSSSKPTEVSHQAMKRMKRVKRVSKMSEKVATGVLSGVVKVSGFFTSAVVNSKVGKKFFSILPGEIILASLDGFEKISDAVEVAGKNVFSTSSVVTTGLVSQRHGEQAAELTKEGLDAAGHAFGTAWAVFKIRKALNPKSVIKATTLAKSAAKAAAAEAKAKRSK
ncbi:hypothetical protein AAC387_Pa07g3605 [Persea americana]